MRCVLHDLNADRGSPLHEERDQIAGHCRRRAEIREGRGWIARRAKPGKDLLAGVHRRLPTAAKGHRSRNDERAGGGNSRN